MRKFPPVGPCLCRDGQRHPDCEPCRARRNLHALRNGLRQFKSGRVRVFVRTFDDAFAYCETLTGRIRTHRICDLRTVVSK